MTNNPDYSALGQIFPDAKSIVCFVHPQATYDAVAAATSLCLAIRETGKSCEVLCEEPMRVEYNYLVGIDKIKETIGNRDLVISFDYNEDQVDKVSYNINEGNNRFELIISPKVGTQALDPDSISFTQSGLSADLIFLFGYHSFSELGELYEKEKYAIEQAYSVAFTQNKVTPFAKMHQTMREENFSYSEMVYFLIRQLQIAQVNDDLATNILSGIEYATDRFMHPEIPARIFETVAALMRSGGRRQPDNPAFIHLNTPIRQTGETSSQGGSQPVFGSGAQNVLSTSPKTPIVARPKTATQSVSSSDFARAMQGEGHKS
jgi:hypothetical protein